jgi:hypothetical protein
MNAGLVLALITFAASALTPRLQAQSCERLSQLVSPTVSITLAKTIDMVPLHPTGARPRSPSCLRSVVLSQ